MSYCNNCEKKQWKFQRIRPYNGLPLTAEDFLEEQTYFREKMKLHNRLHGYGVVCGLEIIANDSADYRIIVKRGMALDWNGNEIIVCKDQTIDLSEKIRELFYKLSPECLTPPGYIQQNDGKNLYIGIKYQEIPAEPEAVLANDSCCEKKRCEFSRIQEGYCIEAFPYYNLPWQPPEFIHLEQGFERFSLHPWELDCPAHEDREHYVLLGYITFEEFKQQPKITKDMVNNYYKHIPAYIESYPSSFSPGQIIATAMVKKICEEAGWINIAFVTGMNIDEAKNEIKAIEGFENVNIQVVTLDKTTLRLILKRAIDYLPFANKDDTIQLIHEDEKDIVLFTVIIPS